MISPHYCYGTESSFFMHFMGLDQESKKWSSRFQEKSAVCKKMSFLSEEGSVFSKCVSHKIDVENKFHYILKSWKRKIDAPFFNGRALAKEVHLWLGSSNFLSEIEGLNEKELCDLAFVFVFARFNLCDAGCYDVSVGKKIRTLFFKNLETCDLKDVGNFIWCLTHLMPRWGIERHLLLESTVFNSLEKAVALVLPFLKIENDSNHTNACRLIEALIELKENRQKPLYREFIKTAVTDIMEKGEMENKIHILSLLARMYEKDKMSPFSQEQVDKWFRMCSQKEDLQSYSRRKIVRLMHVSAMLYHFPEITS